MNPVVLITGVSSGIGRATALAAASSGLTVVGTVRDLARAPDGIECVRVDITDPVSIADGVRAVVERHGRLDALVNNAGVAGENLILEFDDLADLRASMEVNFFGVVAMSRAAMPHLRAAGGRLITISSVRGVIGQPFNEGYSAAKFAVEGFMEGLASVVARVGVTVCLIEPAAVLDTEFINNSSGVDPETFLAQAGPYAPALRDYRQWVRTGAIEGAQTSREVAEVVVRALTGEPPPFRLQTSEHARKYVARKLADPETLVTCGF